MFTRRGLFGMLAGLLAGRKIKPKPEPERLKWTGQQWQVWSFPATSGSITVSSSVPEIWYYNEANIWHEVSPQEQTVPTKA